jgi:predicted RNA binding protein YcfA (HicA-like mRNA interferase family)
MAAITAKDLEKALAKKGFKSEEAKRHTQYFFYYQNKKTSYRVTISRGSNSVYSGDLLGYVSQQMKLSTNQQLQLFIECSFTEKDYIKHLKLDESESKDREK